MPVRGILRKGTGAPGLTSATNAPIYVNSADNLPYIVPAGTGTSEVPFVLGLAGVTGAKMAAGTGALVSGTGTVATGLATVKGITFTVTQPATGTYPTGASEVHSINVVSVTTGSVVIQGVFNSFTTGAATVSVSGTAGFRWVALGT